MALTKHIVQSPYRVKLIVEIYPVGLLAEIQQSWRYKWRKVRLRTIFTRPKNRHVRFRRRWVRPGRIFRHLFAAMRQLCHGNWKLAHEEWRPVKSYFNGYLAEPNVFPGTLTRCGSGWTRKRALKDLQRRVDEA